jgi:hypothetical protein
LPNANFGPILDKDQDASTAGWIRDIFTKGFAPQLEQIPPRMSPYLFAKFITNTVNRMVR